MNSPENTVNETPLVVSDLFFFSGPWCVVMSSRVVMSISAVALGSEKTLENLFLCLQSSDCLPS